MQDVSLSKAISVVLQKSRIFPIRSEIIIMMISVKYNFVFLSNQKCASTSIEAMLKPYSDILLVGNPALRHTNYKSYCQYIEPYIKARVGIESIETICVLREPLSWLHSWYKYRARIALRKSSHPNHINSTFGIAFSDFIKAYLLDSPPPFANVGLQQEFVEDISGNIGVSKIFTYENLDYFLQYMRQKINKGLELERLNSSPKKSTGSNLTSRLNCIKRKLDEARTSSEANACLNLEYGISDTLLAQLREKAYKDFELYEWVSRTYEK